LSRDVSCPYRDLTFPLFLDLLFFWVVGHPQSDRNHPGRTSYTFPLKSLSRASSPPDQESDGAPSSGHGRKFYPPDVSFSGSLSLFRRNSFSFFIWNPTGFPLLPLKVKERLHEERREQLYFLREEFRRFLPFLGGIVLKEESVLSSAIF